MKLIEQIGYLDQARALGPVPPGYTHRYNNHSTGRDYQVFAHLGDLRARCEAASDWEAVE